jgi:ABC-type multidrug transport system fused ATPase/permease subunit
MAVETLPVLATPRDDPVALTRRFLPYIRPHLWRLTAAIVLVVASTVVGLAQMYAVMVGINYVVAADLGAVGFIAVMLGAIALALNLIKVIDGLIMSRLNQLLSVELRHDLLSRVHRLDLGEHTRQVSGEWISRVLFEADRFQKFFTGKVLEIAKSLVWIIGVGAFLLAVNARITLPVLVMIPVLGIVSYRWVRRLRGVFQKQRTEWDKVVGFMSQHLDGVADIRAFGQERAVMDRFEEAAERYRIVHTGLSIKRVVLASFLDLCGFVAIGMIMFFGGLEFLGASGKAPDAVFKGATGMMPMSWMLLGTNKMMATMGMAQGAALSAGALSAFVLFVKRLLNPVRDIAHQLAELADVKVSAGRILDILDRSEEPDHGEALPPVRGRIEFDHVTFGYEEGRPILRDVSLTIEPGQEVAFVGPTGAGKTSLMNLLSRFYEPQTGAIRVDGHDLRTVSPSSLRRQIAVVPQEAVLFDDTVLENVRFGRPEATDAEVVEAAVRAGADGVLGALPEGYRTRVGERGVRLSLGQRQLVALTRAMLAEPRVVVLDEAVSSVDGATQEAVMAAVRRLVQGRTALVVAHRLNLVRDADLVAVVEAGRIVEQGPPERLLEAGGRFATLWETQAQGAASVSHEEA